MTSPHMLLVEDDFALAHLLIWQFEREGFSVKHTPDGREALAMASDRTPDIVLLDWMIDSLPGIDVCRHLRQQEVTLSVPIVMLSAKAQKEDREEALAAGATAYLTKPFSPGELVNHVRQLLSSPPSAGAL